MSEQLRVPGDLTPQEVPTTDPSVLGGNVTPPFDEELYRQKVEFLEGAFQSQTTVHLTAQREILVKAVGGSRQAERVDVWEVVKGQGSLRAYDEVTKMLTEESSNVAKPEEEKDIFDKVVTSVALDMRGTTDPYRVGANVVDFNVGGVQLDGLVDTDKLQDPAVLTKATKTIRLLVADGLYKLHQWGNADQLKTALGLVKTYAEWVPGFDPNEAGFDIARGGLTMALAALQVDQDSKPNYEYAKPERKYLFEQTANGLKQLSTTEAHMFLRCKDIKLPNPEPSQL